MILATCDHSSHQKYGKTRKGEQRYKCNLCGHVWFDAQPKPLGIMRVPVADAKRALHLLAEGNSIRATSRLSGLDKATVLNLLVFFGDACRRFLDQRMRGLTLTHLQFDEQWTYVARKQSRLTLDERAERADVGDVYLWTCVDQRTKLMPAFRVGKRSADNARRFAMDVASRLVFPSVVDSDARNFQPGGYRPIVQISTDGFAAYPEAIDLAFGPYAQYGVIIKQYRNASMIYTPSEMVGTERRGIRGIDRRNERTICTSHVERLNGTQRLFLKRLNRLTYCFSKKVENLEAAFAVFAAFYNFCWQTRLPGTSGKLRPSAAMMAGMAGHVWSFDELFDAVLAV